MAGKPGMRTKLRYWFDNTMSRGISGLIGWLAVASFALIVVVTIALEGVAPADADGQPNNPIRLLWRTFVSTFSLSGIPDDKTEPFAVIGLWFVLALGGIF